MKKQSANIKLSQLFDTTHIIKQYQSTIPLKPPTVQALSLNQFDYSQHIPITKNFLEDYMEQESPFDIQNVCQDFLMEEERNDPYEQINGENTINFECVNKNSKINLLDSSNESRELPHRKSSLSSISSQQNQLFPSNIPPFIPFHNQLLITSQKPFATRQNFIGGNPLHHKNQYQIRPTSSMQIQLPLSTHTIQHKGLSIKQDVNRKSHAAHFHPPRPNNFFQKNVVRRQQIDSSTQKRQRLEKIKKIQQIGCNCRKSKCLKMYCECFNLQIFCSQNCNCCGCGNQQQNGQHKKAVINALGRNPKAFAQDNQQIDSLFKLGLELTEVKKGCKCRKTKCLKKYCECFNSGQACGRFCQCEGCQNIQK